MNKVSVKGGKKEIFMCDMKPGQIGKVKKECMFTGEFVMCILNVTGSKSFVDLGAGDIFTNTFAEYSRVEVLNSGEEVTITLE